MTPTAGGAARNASPGPQDSPGFLLWRTTLHWQRRLTAALHPLELTHVQFVLLASVWWLSESSAEEQHQAPSQRQVAEHAGTDVMMTSQVLRTLEKRGLVSRTPDHTDTRIKRLAITQAGRHLAEQAITIAEATDAQFFAQARDPAHLLDILHQLADYPTQ